MTYPQVHSFRVPIFANATRLLAKFAKTAIA
jgi:hypothetical protein